jgi:hypothetical protein
MRTTLATVGDLAALLVAAAACGPRVAPNDAKSESWYTGTPGRAPSATASARSAAPKAKHCDVPAWIVPFIMPDKHWAWAMPKNPDGKLSPPEGWHPATPEETAAACARGEVPRLPKSAFTEAVAGFAWGISAKQFKDSCASEIAETKPDDGMDRQLVCDRPPVDIGIEGHYLGGFVKDQLVKLQIFAPVSFHDLTTQFVDKYGPPFYEDGEASRVSEVTCTANKPRSLCTQAWFWPTIDGRREELFLMVSCAGGIAPVVLVDYTTRDGSMAVRKAREAVQQNY